MLASAVPARVCSAARIPGSLKLAHWFVCFRSGDNTEGLHCWRPVPPDSNFVALGMVATTTPKMPSLGLVRCVPRGAHLSWQCLLVARSNTAARIKCPL